MADVYDKGTRSSVMRKVRSKGNKSTELRLISLFHETGIKGWRRGYPVKGHPDFVFKANRVAVFVDGCFWHGHDCRNTQPRENKDYWVKKRERNRMHDQEITAIFENRGWTVIRIWECELKKNNRNALMEKLKPISCLASGSNIE